MWDKCESCGKSIESAADCRLTTHDGKAIHTYCLACYNKRKQAELT